MAQERKRNKGPWSREELELLKKLFPVKSTLEMADRLNRSFSSVKREAILMGLSRRKEREWSREEVKQLKKMYATTSTWKIANQFGRSTSAVKRKAREIGLMKQREKR